MLKELIQKEFDREQERVRLEELPKRARVLFRGYQAAKDIAVCIEEGATVVLKDSIEVHMIVDYLWDLSKLGTFTLNSEGDYVHFLGKHRICGIGTYQRKYLLLRI